MENRAAERHHSNRRQGRRTMPFVAAATTSKCWRDDHSVVVRASVIAMAILTLALAVIVSRMAMRKVE